MQTEVSESPTEFALRTIIMTIMRATFTRVAPLTSTAMCIGIPTEYNENRYTNSSIPIYFSILL